MARILYVSQGYSTHDRRFLDRLAQTNHDIWFQPCAADRVQYEARPVPSAIHRLAPLSNTALPPGSAKWLVPWLRFRRRILHIRPDLIHAGPIQTGGFLAALSGVHPLLVMSWGSDVLLVPDASRKMHWLTTFTLHRADMVLGDCSEVRRRVVSLSALKPDQIVCFPWGIDLQRFRPRPSGLRLRQKLGWDGCQVVVSTRSFEPVHGTMVFLEAIRRVFEQRPEARVLMLGDGSLRQQVDVFVKTNGLADKIYLPGQVREETLADYFAEGDLYVSATYCDGSSISLLQAMGCGLPVVVVDGCGNREWVTHRENGWLYPAGDARALTAVILEALSSEAARVSMAQANAAVARARANWEKNFPQLLTAYDRLLGGSGTRGARTHA